MSRRPTRLRSALLLLPLAACPTMARAQTGVSPEAAPAAPEATIPQLNPTDPQLETTPVDPPAVVTPATATLDAATPSEKSADVAASNANIDTPGATPPIDPPAPARLEAASITYQGKTIMASGTPEKPVRFESAAGLVLAQEVRLDVATQQLQASGAVQFERERVVARKDLNPRRLPTTATPQTFRETAFGNNLIYDFKTGIGTLDAAKLRLATLTISVEALEINGKSYRARNVVLRPGGLTDEELKIYGTPPFTLRARQITVDPVEKNGELRSRATLKGGSLYFKNTRILPVPTYSFFPGGSGNDGPRIIPGISFNSGDQFLVTANFKFPFSQAQPDRLSATTDVGFSQRVGFRGGIGLVSSVPPGNFALNLRKNDVITSQLTNRIQLDRTPELTYSSPAFLQFDLGKQRAGFAFDASLGDFSERLLGAGARTSTTRAQSRLVLTTRLQPGPGAFARLFSSYSSYGSGGTYRNNGVELGYYGQFLRRLRGQVSVRLTDIKGQTPFRFDTVEIRRELRATVDYQLSPRYILPFDLRYDLQSNRFRDQTFGLLRSYKTFAYGVTYQTARRDLRLEIRQGF